MRWQAVLVGGLFAGLGGAFFTIGSTGAFIKDITVGNGFIALAAVIMGRWNLVRAALMALFFGFVTQLASQLQTLNTPMPSQFLLMLLYLATIVAVAGLIGRSRGPAADGVLFTATMAGIDWDAPRAAARSANARTRPIRATGWGRPRWWTTAASSRAATWRTRSLRRHAVRRMRPDQRPGQRRRGTPARVHVLQRRRGGHHAVRPLPAAAVEHGGADLLVETPAGIQRMDQVLPQAFGADDLGR